MGQGAGSRVENRAVSSYGSTGFDLYSPRQGALLPDEVPDDGAHQLELGQQLLGVAVQVEFEEQMLEKPGDHI
jgi:hypothetical protein